MGYVLPSGPSPCTWLSHAQSTMPDKTPQPHAVAVTTCLVRSTYDQAFLGLPEFYDVSLPACHGLWTPVDLHILANNGSSCIAFGER
jgi:hypothetical protein